MFATLDFFAPGLRHRNRPLARRLANIGLPLWNALRLSIGTDRATAYWFLATDRIARWAFRCNCGALRTRAVIPPSSHMGKLPLAHGCAWVTHGVLSPLPDPPPSQQLAGRLAIGPSHSPPWLPLVVEYRQLDGMRGEQRWVGVDGVRCKPGREHVVPRLHGSAGEALSVCVCVCVCVCGRGARGERC